VQFEWHIVLQAVLICAALLSYHIQPFVLVRDNQLQLSTWLFLSLILSVVTVSDTGDSGTGTQEGEDNATGNLDTKGMLLIAAIFGFAFVYVARNVVARFVEQGSIETAEALPRPEHPVATTTTKTHSKSASGFGAPRAPKQMDIIWKQLNEGDAKPTIEGLMKWFACRQPLGCQSDFVHIISEVPAFSHTFRSTP
jgi:hypothetical protein